MKYIEKIISVLMLVFAVGFNLWLYRLEPTAVIDPNDNAFQFALVDRTNAVWDFATKECSKNYLTFGICHFSFLSDHWVNNWAQGYNLPFYYSHIPQITIVASWKFFHWIFGLLDYSFIGLFTYYHWIIYLLLCFFPISVFLALRIIRLPWVIAGIGALISTHISTDGLYGLDPSSYLWRGYGLSSQLFAMIPLPLAIAYSFRFFSFIPSLRASGREFFAELVFCLYPIRTIIAWRGGTKFSQFASRASETRKNGETNPDRERAAEQENFRSAASQAKIFWLAVLFIFATTAGHLGIGIITIMSLFPIAIAHPLLELLHQQPMRYILTTLARNLFALVLLAGTSIFFLSYWIIPILLGNDFHNVSFWDPVWKFNSYGWFEIMKNLFTGTLYDFGRKPYFTLFVLTGALGVLAISADINKRSSLTTYNLFPFSLLFLFWLLLYFGRTTWGGLIDLIPGMKEFHISRFIVGLHMVGFFLAPIGIMCIANLITDAVSKLFIKFSPSLRIYSLTLLLSYCLIVLLTLPPIYKQTIAYNQHNDRLIKQANENRAKTQADEEALFAAIRSLPPGRVFAGRGGWWGKDFRVAETPYYMHLSTFGLPTSLWLPETWSPNSDVEQYFSEDQAYTYDLFNLKYVAAPPGQNPEKFWKLVNEAPTWKLYETPTTGYFTTGIHAAIVTTDKLSYANVVRLWIQSEYPKKQLYPQIHLGKLGDVKDSPLPRFGMLDEVNYSTLDGKTYNLFAANPVYMGPEPKVKLTGNEEVTSDMIFKTKVEVQENCQQCLVILKQSYHPNWRVRVNGQSVKPFIVFPFFIGIPVTSPGTYEVVAAYKPSALKVALLLLEIAAAASLFVAWGLKWKLGTSQSRSTSPTKT